MARSLSSLLPMAVSTTVIAIVVVFVFNKFKKREHHSLKSEKTNEEVDEEDEAEAVAGHSTDLHGRPWKNMKKHKKAQWWAANGQIDKDTQRIQESTKNIIYPDAPISEDNIQDWLTVVMTTSPVTSNPNTDLICEVGKSLLLVEHLTKCSKLIICDGYKVRGKNKFRSGEITEERVAAYIEYKKNLHALTQDSGSIFADAQILELEERNGFGYAMREGIAHVTTPYMIVVQHDRNFTTGFDLIKVVRAMRRHHDWCHYVGLPTSRTIKHANIILSKYTMRVSTLYADVGTEKKVSSPRVYSEDVAHLDSIGCEAATGDWWSANKDRQTIPSGSGTGSAASSGKDSSDECSPDAVSLVPLVQWYDSTHIASTAYYRNFVFDRRVKRVAKGGFIEDKLGQQQLKVILERGIRAHKPYGTFILADLGEKTVVSHLDGHDPRNAKRFIHSD